MSVSREINQHDKPSLCDANPPISQILQQLWRDFPYNQYLLIPTQFPHLQVIIIMGECDLPFEEGQEVETRSFIKGFRGAWFRCKIELHPCPVGEGNPNDEPYEGSRKDLRPSLDWSPENGWTVLTAMERENGNPCARVMKPGNQGGIPSLSTYSVGHGRREKQLLGTITENEMLTSETHAESDGADSGIVKTSCSDSVLSSHLKSASKGVQRTTTEKDRVDNTGSLKKMKTDGSIVLNSMSSDTLEAAILDLEELVNRVKWMKSILEIGMPLASVPPTWKFL